MTATEYPIENLTIAQMVESFTNARTPTTHGSTHISTDAIPVATTLNPGLCPAGTGTGMKVLTDLLTWGDIDHVSGFRPVIYIGPSDSGAEYECDGANDQVQFNAALTAATSGQTICILPGTYYITSRIYQAGKSLNIRALGKVAIVKNVTAAVSNGIYLEGSIIATNISVTANAAAGDTQITVSSGSSFQAGDTIKLWKNVQWCPDDYADQLTGEMYKVKSVSGNVVTLTENLVRAYATSDTPLVNVYRPIEVHIDGINIVDLSSTAQHEGISLRYCVDSTVSNCTVTDSGFAGISFYSSYNARAFNNNVNN